ncbi:hypothetical protein AOQ84DRAFT_353907 [Glonium stellatum]|uniref:Uncharacterized protein n=1 Tax=Glonium stellatum TaxID=574774 RepID=A0A8E2F3M1_9PEZI|nr:hypothetical protein AOQ84DRAFT_353907 [Glonium stellatum]
MSSAVVSLITSRLFFISDAAPNQSRVLESYRRPDRSTVTLVKRKEATPKTKAIDFEALTRMIGAWTFIQARAEKLGSRCHV